MGGYDDVIGVFRGFPMLKISCILRKLYRNFSIVNVFAGYTLHIAGFMIVICYEQIQFTWEKVGVSDDVIGSKGIPQGENITYL